MRRRATGRLLARAVPVMLVALAMGTIAPAFAQQRQGGPSKPKFSERQIMATKDWAAGDCTDVMKLTGLDGQTDAALGKMLGAPSRKDTFLLGERQDEFHVALQNHYPLTVAANAAVRLQEWTWEKGACRLTIWLHKPAADWVALENLRYPGDAEF